MNKTTEELFSELEENSLYKNKEQRKKKLVNQITKQIQADVLKEVYQLAKDEINQSSADNVPIYVRDMIAIKSFAGGKGIDLN